MKRHTVARSVGSLAFAVLLGGCVSGPAGLGQEAGTTELPLGLSLLSSSESSCDDSVHIGSSSVTGGRLGPEMFVAPGENATFRISESAVVWACTEDDSSEFHEVDCAGATHLRVTRATEDGDVLLECFG